jgi:hypothetical protein
VGACAHRLGDATGGSALDAGGASPDNARRSGPALWPFIRRLAHLARDDRPGQLAEHMTHGALRRGVLRPGAGHRQLGQRPATGALPRKREQGQAAPHLRRESPTPFAAPSHHSPISFTLSVYVPCILASRDLGRSAWRAEGAPLKP